MTLTTEMSGKNVSLFSLSHFFILPGNILVILPRTVNLS